MSRIADRNLLWGVLALQVEFITRDALIDGMTAWAADKGRDLEDILVERGALAPGHRDALAPLLAFHIGRHGDDPAKSLAALSSIGPAREAVGQVDDPDVRASLGHVGADAFATRYEPDGGARRPIRTPRPTPRPRSASAGSGRTPRATSARSSSPATRS